jgi:hypothetical protein
MDIVTSFAGLIKSLISFATGSSVGVPQWTTRVVHLGGNPGMPECVAPSAGMHRRITHPPCWTPETTRCDMLCLRPQGDHLPRDVLRLIWPRQRHALLPAARDEEDAASRFVCAKHSAR